MAQKKEQKPEERLAEKRDFESLISELEKVVTELDGEVQLEKALDLFERGMKISTDCETFLKNAEQKVEILKRTADGELEITQAPADLLSKVQREED